MHRIRRTLTVVLVSALGLALALPAPLAAAAVRGAAAPRPAIVVAYDAFDGSDGVWKTAPVLPEVTRHAFGGLAENYLFTGDEDWFKLDLASGQPVTVNVLRLDGQGGSYLDVYGSTNGECDATSTVFAGPADPTGATYVLGGSSQPGWWVSGMTKLNFVAPKAGTYYFRHRPAAGVAAAGYDRDAIPNVAKQATYYELHVVAGAADRLSGPTRYGTSVAVARQMWNASDDPWWWEGPWGNGVIVVSGENYADGLAATALSLRAGIPVLLTKRDVLPADVAAELHRLASSNWWRAYEGDNRFTVYICGSDVAVSDAVESQIGDDPFVSMVKRLEGPSRYDTAARIADEIPVAALDASPSVPATEAFVINGTAWADGLAAGPVAAFAKAPVLMVARDSLPSVTADWLTSHGIKSVHIVGSEAVVPASVAEAIAALPTKPAVDRIAGGNRYETAYRLARYGVEHYGMSGKSCTVVSGESAWDALSAGQLSFMTYAPLLLTPKTGLSPYVAQFRADNHGFSAPAYIVGGEAAVSGTAFGQLRDLWATPAP